MDLYKLKWCTITIQFCFLMPTQDHGTSPKSNGMGRNHLNPGTYCSVPLWSWTCKTLQYFGQMMGWLAQVCSTCLTFLGSTFNSFLLLKSATDSAQLYYQSFMIKTPATWREIVTRRRFNWRECSFLVGYLSLTTMKVWVFASWNLQTQVRRRHTMIWVDWRLKSWRNNQDQRRKRVKESQTLDS